jgi:diguanylate cyclase (GGDEF)-like protein
MARTFAYLFAAGATVLLVTLPLPHAADRELAGLLTVGAIAYLASGAFVVGFDRLPAWAYRGAPIVAAGLVAAALYFGGSTAAGAYAMFLFWVVVGSGFFFELRLTLVYVAIATAVYAFVLVLEAEPPLPLLHWTMAAGTLLMAGLITVGLRGQVDRLVARLADAAGTDPLTGLSNRREFEDRFGTELERSTRSGRPLGLIAVDLDWFKQVNDRFGHEVGDRVLQYVGVVLERETRAIDTVARLGGEEFAVLAPEASQEHTYILAERLRAAVKGSFAERREGPLTLSCGIATFPISGGTGGDLMRAADRALYTAKDLGRDRTVVFRPAEMTMPAGRPEPRAPATVDAKLAPLFEFAEFVDRRKGRIAHSARVGRYAEELALGVGLSDGEARRVAMAALLRDVGEIGLPRAILGKSGPLSEAEWREMRRHPEIGARIVSTVEFDGLQDWIHSHHERVDGRGYPRGLIGEEIPLGARILAIADAYAAMRSDRADRGRVSPERALDELLTNSGTQFDPELVEAFLGLATTVEEEAY